VNGSGLVTGIASGICAIKATASDNASAFASTAVGVALLSANSLTIAYGNNATISMSGDSPAVNWCGGCPGPAEVVAGTLVNGFVVAEVAEHSSTAWNSGPTATIITPVYQGPGTPATAHVPIFVSIGGIYLLGDCGRYQRARVGGRVT